MILSLLNYVQKPCWWSPCCVLFPMWWPCTWFHCPGHSYLSINLPIIIFSLPNYILKSQPDWGSWSLKPLESIQTGEGWSYPLRFGFHLGSFVKRLLVHVAVLLALFSVKRHWTSSPCLFWMHAEQWRWQSWKNNPSVVQPGGPQKRLSYQSHENRQVSKLNKAHIQRLSTTSWKSEYKQRVHVWAPWMGGWKWITLPKGGSCSLGGLCRHWAYQIRIWGQMLLFTEPSGVWRRWKKIKSKSGDAGK